MHASTGSNGSITRDIEVLEASNLGGEKFIIGKVMEINSSPNVHALVEEEDVEDPEIAQDLYIAEHNNDDIDDEEIDEISLSNVDE